MSWSMAQGGPIFGRFIHRAEHLQDHAARMHEAVGDDGPENGVPHLQQRCGSDISDSVTPPYI